MQDQLLEAGKEWEHLTDQEQEGKTEQHKRPGTEKHKNKEEKRKKERKGVNEQCGEHMSPEPSEKERRGFIKKKIS